MIAGRPAMQVFRRSWGLVTAPARAMPDFMIIGAQKAGTTSLFEYLSSHPGVFPASTKEVQYFSHQYGRGALWYRSHFATRSALRRATSRLGYRALAGEASPYYLAHPLAAERAKKAVPQASLVVLLRDPVERAHSHWRMLRRMGRERLGFEAAIAAEKDRLAGELDRIQSGREVAGARHQLYSYVTRGRYAAELAPWIDRFGRDRLLVLQAERLFTEPGPVYEQMLAHLGLPSPDAPPVFTAHGAGRSSGPIPASAEAELRRVFAEDNARLYEMTGVDYS